jgi:hypothetical protein
VDVIHARYLERWIAKAPANREIANRLAVDGEKLANDLRLRLSAKESSSAK